MFDTEEYYGGLYDSPSELEEEEQEEFDYGDYIDYVYDSYKDNLLTKDFGGADNE